MTLSNKSTAKATEKPDSKPKQWCVYIIQASDDRFYTGITTDIERRWAAHMSGKGGAKFFRGRQPQTLCYLEPDHNRSSASRREAEIKKLKRHEKERLINEQPSQLKICELLTQGTRMG